MALKKSLMNSKGQDFEYHKIIAVAQIYSGEQNGININLASYTNQNYRQQNEQEMIVCNTPIFLPFNEIEEYSRQNLYNRIKTEIPEFENSEDC
jgi:hypothetical protein